MGLLFLGMWVLPIIAFIPFIGPLVCLAVVIIGLILLLRRWMYEWFN